jgi:transposase
VLKAIHGGESVPRKPDFFLTETDIDELQTAEEAARRSNDLALYRRLRALLLVGRDCQSRYEAADILGIEHSAIFRWQQRFRNGGVAAMATRKAPGRQSKLSSQDLQRLAEMIEAGPEASGFDTGTWTSAIIKQLVQKTLGHNLSASQLRRILAKLNFSYQMPKKRLALADPVKQREWAEHRFPALLQKAADEDAEIFFRTSPSSSNQEPSPEAERGWVRDSKY